MIIQVLARGMANPQTTHCIQLRANQSLSAPIQKVKLQAVQKPMNGNGILKSGSDTKAGHLKTLLLIIPRTNHVIPNLDTT